MEMSETRRHGTPIGWLGILCLGVYWTGRFAPDVADTFVLSSFGKFVVLGALPAGILLTTIAGIRVSKWWFSAAVAGTVSLVELYIRFSRVMR